MDTTFPAVEEKILSRGDEEEIPAGLLHSRENIQELNGLRGSAILLVMVHHFWPVKGPLAEAGHVAHLGWMGVDLFFVISGLLIGGILLDSAGSSHYYRDFFARRSLRIFPLYYVIFVLMAVCIPRLQGSDEFFRQSGSPLWYLLYAGNWREAFTGHEPAYVLAPLWSLSIEEQFYFTFPWVVKQFRRARLKQAMLLLLVFAPLFRCASYLLFPSNERIQYLATFSRMDCIAVGVLLAIVLREPGRSLRIFRSALAPIVSIAAIAMAFMLGFLNRVKLPCRSLGYSLLALSFAAIVMWAVTNRGTKSTALLRIAPLTYLGKICYGTYLLQRPVSVVLGKVLMRAHAPLGPVTLMVATICVTIAVAALSWHCFEKPILLLKHYFEHGRESAPRLRVADAVRG